MFQSFDDPAGGAGKERVARLRAELARLSLTGFLVPHADEFQSEYLPPSAERLAWLTGFTGSAGFAVVLKEAAALFVDGRYTLQAAKQTDPGVFAIVHLIEEPPSKWLAGKLKAGDRIGYDPWLLTVRDVSRFKAVCEAAGAALVPLAANPIDAIWNDRPAPPLAAVALHPTELAGESSAAKIERIRKPLAAKHVDAAILTQADSIAWLFNIRGADVAHNPVALSYAVLPKSGRPTLFIDGRKLSNAVRATLSESIDIGEPQEFPSALSALGKAGAKVLIDAQTAAAAIGTALADTGATLVEGSDPVTLPKAKKNEAELAGTRRAHIRDGAAMVRFLAWLERSAPADGLDEIAAAQKLEAFRADTARRDGSELAEISFDTISGAGPNGAVVHYRVTKKTARPLDAGTLFLVDSGGQYRDGTTDITRTVAIGTPTPEMRDRYTRVLKGHIAVGTARFPAGTTGAQIDGLARVSLWQAGLDYDHGTGHGVGVFLCVHEGPARITKLGTVPLETGMILSNEPGYYRTGAYGIRIENLVAVTPPADIAGGDRPMHAFETLSLCPYDRSLMELGLLTAEERGWIDAYHARLPGILFPLLDEAERAWLGAVCRSL
jgi:Xaa-Pro aminopeptidase